MREEIFADGVGEIYFSGGMVRIDYMTIQPRENEAPELKSGLRLVMPPQGFLASYNTMRGFIDKLLEVGVLKKNGNAGEKK